MDLFTTTNEFNSSLLKGYEANRWKFLEDMSPNEAEGVGYLIQSPKPVLTLTLGYILFVKLIGPWLMSKREAYQLKSIIRFYNLVMVFLAAALVMKLYAAHESFDMMFKCDKMFSLQDNSATNLYHMSNFIILVRLSEYLDTVFFTLRKKQNQVTFLHVYHHAFVPIYAYWILRTAPTRYNTFIVCINSLVHVIMYFYYFLATFQEQGGSVGVEGKRKTHKSFLLLVVDKVLVFKKYVTQMQIVQFVILFFYSASVIFRPNRCGVPWTYVWANIFLASSFLGLFLHFYVNVYKKAANRKIR